MPQTDLSRCGSLLISGEKPLFGRSLRLLSLVIGIAIFSPIPRSVAQETNTSAAPAASRSDRSGQIGRTGKLEFNFSSADWRSVIQWMAEEADLSLQIDQIPVGTFSFSDPTRSYTTSEALDVLNLSLMKRGYSLVRRGRLLQLIDLEADNADKLISEIAEIVTPDALEQRGLSDIVSAVFPLASMSPDSAREELAQLIGPWGRVVVLESARQVKVTETARKLISIRELLRSAASAEANVTEIVLQNRSADELLEIARPLLGLDPGQNSNDDIRISIGPLADRIYATGLPGKTALLEALIKKADSPVVMASSVEGEELALPILRTHVINSADTATVFDVLQTLLAGTPDARIAIDPRTDSIVARARPETHDMIEQSIAEMEGNGQDFKIIELRRLDPAQALLTINKFFGVTETGGDGPTVDGDPETGRLWIRGTKDQIATVERLIGELEGTDTMNGLGEKVRILPYTGKAAQDAVMQVESLWSVMGRPNRIREISPSNLPGGSGYQPGIPERRILRDETGRAGESPSTSSTQEVLKPGSLSDAEGFEANLNANPHHTLVSDNGEAEDDADASSVGSRNPATTVVASPSGADIIIQMTPAGLLVASEDTEALDAFESLMQSVAAPSSMNSDLPTIYWLKYAEADQAAELVSKVLGGVESSLSSAMDSLGGGFGGGMLGGLMGLGGGGGGDTSTAKSVLTSTGSVSIVPDARLNALIVQANAADLNMIEMILEKIDRPDSPEDVQTKGRPALIPVIYQDAAEVANVVKEVLGERIQGQSSGQRAAGGGGGGGNPSPRDFFNALRGGGGNGNQAAASEPAKISIAVDAKSNALVVVATPQDFEEVRDLVEQIDQMGMTAEETVSTYTISGNVNPDVMKLALESILGTQAGSSQTDKPGGAGGASSQASGAAQSASDIQQRIEFFRQLRGGGGAGGAGGGRPGGGAGGFGGGGGRPGGGAGGAGARGGGAGARGGGGGGRGGR